MQNEILRVAAQEYHADPCEVPSLSASLAHKLIDGCPLDAWAYHPRLGNKARFEPTAAMDGGNVLHELVLGKGPGLHIVDAKDWRTNAAKEQKELARKEGLIPILIDQANVAQFQAAQIREALRGKGIELAGASEVAFAWTEETFDGAEVQCRGMIDHYVDGVVYDLKIYDSANPRVLRRKFINMGSHIQAAAYLRGIGKVKPGLAGQIKFKWLVVQLYPAVQVVVAPPGATMFDLGTRQWRRAVDTWGRCLAADDWPGYTEGEVEIEAPEWALAADYEDTIEVDDE